MADTLNKTDLVKAISEGTGYTKIKSTEVIEILIEIIKSTLESGEDVLISRFGKFCIKQKLERKGRNPATGCDMIFKARKVVTFKCSRELKKRINKL